MTDDTIDTALQTLDTTQWNVVGKYPSADNQHTLIIRKGELPNGGGPGFTYYVQPVAAAKDDFTKMYHEKMGPMVPWQSDGSCYFAHHAAAREGLSSDLAFAIGPIKFDMGINFFGVKDTILRDLQNDHPRLGRPSGIIVPPSYRGV